MKTLIPICFILLFLVSCQKEDFVRGKVINGEFIEAEIDGQLTRLASIPAFGRYAYYQVQRGVDSTIILDQMQLERVSENGNTSITLVGTNLNLLDASFPLEVSADQIFSGTEPFVTMILWQERISDSPPSSKSGSTNLTLLSWDENDILEGTFSGEVVGSGAPTVVENGTFRIWVPRP